MINSKFLMLCACMFVLVSGNVSAQTSGLISGPWAGNVELRTATIWVEVSAAVKKVAVRCYNLSLQENAKTFTYNGKLGQPFNPVKIDVFGLAMNSTYRYEVLLDDKKAATTFPTKFTTKLLWQYRQAAPDFTFLAGSCAYFNEPVYDRPGKPYGGDSSIFNSMAKTPAAFHIWMGDNWYTREPDFTSKWGLTYRASRDRGLKILQPFIASMPQYAIWDDHDYGPDNAGKSFELRKESRDVFMQYSANPTYGENGMGIYTRISYSDADFFLTDDRYFRSDDNMPDSIHGVPNTNKHFFGLQQMEWLKNALLFSKANFKIIVVGSQVLNAVSTAEHMRSYSAEYWELMHFLADTKLKGVIFLSGDRHHSEVVKEERQGLYPLYDITISPYTAGVAKVAGPEIELPQRVTGTLVEAQNFGRISITGPAANRKFTVDFLGIDGAKLSGFTVSLQELQ